MFNLKLDTYPFQILPFKIVQNNFVKFNISDTRYEISIILLDWRALKIEYS